MRLEVPVKYLSTRDLAESDGFEDLRAAVALQGGDAHLAEGLQESLVDALDVVGHGLLVGADGLEREIGIDGARAVADEQGEVHHLARLAAFDDEGDLGARLFADQVIVDRGHGQQAGDGSVFFVDAAVGENQQRVAGLDGQRGAPAQLGERALQTLGAVFDGKQHGQRGGQEIALADAAHLFQIAIGEDGMRQLQGVAVLRRLVEDVALGADVAGERHDHLFADGVDGRVGDLREQLLEVDETGAAVYRKGRPAACPCPCEPMGSSPFSAMGPRTMRMSSSV